MNPYQSCFHRRPLLTSALAPVCESPRSPLAERITENGRQRRDAQLECRREKVMGSNLTQSLHPKAPAQKMQSKTQIAKVDENEDQIVCKKEKVMGSNLRKRVCYRKKDRDARNKSDQDDYREMSTRSVRPGASTLD